MAKVCDILDYYDEIAPYYMKMDFDNVGHLVGFHQMEVNKALVALDITDEVIQEAIEMEAQLILSHHPLIFHPLQRVTDDDTKGKKIIQLIRHGISAICLHTNMDAANGGVNDCLMDALGAKVTGLLNPHGQHPNGSPYGISRVGRLSDPIPLVSFLSRTKEVLGCSGIRYVDGGKPVEYIACCGGAGGGDMLKAYQAGCDTYVTADLKYDHFLEAKELGLNLVDADHFCTENVVIPYLMSTLSNRFPEIEAFVSSVHHQIIQFF